MFVQVQMQLYIFSTCHCVLDAYIQEQVFNKEPGNTNLFLYTPVLNKLSHLSVKLEFTL